MVLKLRGSRHENESTHRIRSWEGKRDMAELKSDGPWALTGTQPLGRIGRRTRSRLGRKQKNHDRPKSLSGVGVIARLLSFLPSRSRGSWAGLCMEAKDEVTMGGVRYQRLGEKQEREGMKGRVIWDWDWDWD